VHGTRLTNLLDRQHRLKSRFWEAETRCSVVMPRSRPYLGNLILNGRGVSKTSVALGSLGWAVTL
jgi:hypothetical protein